MNFLFLKSYMGSYIGTYSYAILSIITMLLMTGVFSRYWSSSEFLDFTTILRYMGIIVTISSFSLGFSIIAKRCNYSLKHEIYPVVFWGVFTSSLVLGFLYTVLSNTPAFIVLWIISASIFHVYISSIRSESSAEANFISIQVKVILIIFVVIVCTILHLNLLSYFGIYGFLTLAFITWGSVKHGYHISPDHFSLKIAVALYTHASSRAVDNLARLLFHIIPVWIADTLLSSTSAGLIVLTLIITKTFESSIQPVVLHIHANRVKDKVKLSTKKLLAVMLVSIAITILGSIFFHYFGVATISTWITKEYVVILEYINITIWSIPCIILLQFMRSEMESRVSTSPFVYINMLSVILLLILSVWLSNSIITLLYTYVGVYILKVIACFFYITLFLKNFRNITTKYDNEP